MEQTPLSASLAELNQFVVGERSIADTLSRLTELVQQAIPPAELVGITMVVDGRERTTFFTDPLVPEIDQAQYDSGEGPCIDAYRHQREFAIESTLQDGAWPAFRAAAAQRSIRSTLSLPMGVAQHRLGALNLYSTVDGAFDEQARSDGRLFAAQASVVLGNARAYWDSADLSRRLADAASTRTTIDLAKGIIMASRRCSEEEAFQVLVAASQRENRKLRDVAARMVRNVTDPPGSPRP